MRHSRLDFFVRGCLVSICLVATTGAGALTVSTVSHVGRPSSSVYGAAQISGITYAGGDLFYAVDDNDGKLYPITLAIDRSSGALATDGIAIGTGVLMSGGDDMEGCAFDPASGNVWISQETGALIREFSPATGALLRSASVPAVQGKYNGNYSLEALTIAGDGKTMWTANEEALTVDGDLASSSAGSLVRLTRFVRNSVRDGWTPDGEWAYVTDPIGTEKDSNTRSGVSGLCALPDGTLLVLERRCYQGGLFPDFNIRIYQVDFAGATDVASYPSLKDASYAQTTKALLWQYAHGNDMPNYEGICLGPGLDDGTCVLVLVSDGGSSAEKGLFTLKLSGLPVGTIEFREPSVGVSSIVGTPYRFTCGSKVDVVLEGAQTPPSAYTNNNALCRDVGWRLSGSTPLSGTGPLASFTVSADGVFDWETLSETVAHTPIVGGDTFEELAVGTQLGNGDVAGWSGEGVIAAGRPSQSDADCSMPLAGHAKTLTVDFSAQRSYGCNVTNANQTLDMMITVYRCPDDVLEPQDDDGAAGQTSIAADKDGRLNVWTRNGWVRLSEIAYSNGEWVRLTVSLDYAAHKAAVSVNGAACGAYDLVDAAATAVSEVEIVGTCSVDDVYLRVDDGGAVAITPASEIVVDDPSVVDTLRVTAAFDEAAQALLAADADKMARFCSIFEPVLGADGRTVSFRPAARAVADETAKLVAAFGSVDFHVVAAGSEVEVTIADTTPGLYYTLKSGTAPGGMAAGPSILGDGTDKTFILRRQGDSGFYRFEVGLEPSGKGAKP